MKLTEKGNKLLKDKTENKPYVEGNNTGIPDLMKSQFEKLSGFSFDDVCVHYNSDKPAQLQAFAYTQGNHVYIGPGQEKHLRHELGHVVQQKQGRVKPTRIINDMAFNDELELEIEADKIVQCKTISSNGEMTEVIQFKSWCVNCGATTIGCKCDDYEEYNDEWDDVYDVRDGYEFNPRALESMDDFWNNVYVYQNKYITTKITMRGTRSKDCDIAEKNTISKPNGYTWHHHKDYNNNNKSCTMSLVKTDWHRKNPHMGACLQYAIAARKAGREDFKYK